ncbi:hypothetical protein DPMN_135026, partial [Dreissena polymorpha]
DLKTSKYIDTHTVSASNCDRLLFVLTQSVPATSVPATSVPATSVPATVTILSSHSQCQQL